jgi:hypothetical protein
MMTNRDDFDSNKAFGSDSQAHERDTNPKRKSGFSSKNPNNERLVVLATFESAMDAHAFRNELESQGIDACVANETTTATFGMSPVGPLSSFWIEVLVLESDAERALEIKNLWQDKFTTEETEIPSWVCDCGETVDEGFGVCWNCNAQYEEEYEESDEESDEDSDEDSD